jgi:hypothetical protein
LPGECSFMISPLRGSVPIVARPLFQLSLRMWSILAWINALRVISQLVGFTLYLLSLDLISAFLRSLFLPLLINAYWILRLPGLLLLILSWVKIVLRRNYASLLFACYVCSLKYLF